MNHQDKYFGDTKLTNLGSRILNRNPTSDDEVVNKNHVIVELDKNTVLRKSKLMISMMKNNQL